MGDCVTEMVGETTKPLTFLSVMLRPKWVLGLLLTLLVATVFAGFGKWQVERGFEQQRFASSQGATEDAVRLNTILSPGQSLSSIYIGQKVHMPGFFRPGQEVILEGRTHHDQLGWWVVSQFVTSEQDGESALLAVARGWASSAVQAEKMLHELATHPPVKTVVEGRTLPSEAPEVFYDVQRPQAMTTLSVAALYNIWESDDEQGVYSAFVLQQEAPTGLETIEALAPLPQAELNWLNMFYAIEWIVFAGFAFYFWYRLVKDAHRKEMKTRG